MRPMNKLCNETQRIRRAAKFCSNRYYLEDPNQLFADPQANSTSLRNLTSTIKIPNETINNIEELTDSLAKVAWKRHELLRLLTCD